MSFLVLLALQVAIESPREAFERAESFYQEQQFAQAAEVYESVRAAGIEDGVLYYNLGNAYFKAGSIGRAILSYERARLLLPGDDDVRTNLSFANELVAEADVEAPLPTAVRWAVDLYRSIAASAFAAILSVAFVVGGALGTFVLADRGSRFQPQAVSGLFVCALVALLSGACLFAKVRADEGRTEAIVLTQNAYVRSGPGEANPRLAEIHEGIKVRVLAERDDWYQVGLASGLTGWLRRAEIEPI